MKGQPKLTCLCFFDYYGLSRKKRASFLPKKGPIQYMVLL